MTFLRAGGATTTYTYEELFNRAGRIGSRLAARGVDKSAPFGILMQSQEDQVLHYLGALQAGAVPAILTPPNRKLNRQYYQQTMDVVLRRCAFSSVVTDVEGIEFPTRRLAPHSLDPVDSPGCESSTEEDETPVPLDASFLQFSSGTTGIKRGVLVSDAAVSAQLEAYSSAIGLNEADCILSWLPLYHDMGFIACLNMPLAFGVHSVMLDPIDWVSKPAMYLQAASRYRATLSWHPNFAFAFMAQRIRASDLEGVNLSSLRGLINCSEPVTHESQQAFLDRYAEYGLSPKVFKGCYAMAETTFALTHGEPDHEGYLDATGPLDGTKSPSPSGYVSVGYPLPGVEMKIVEPYEIRDLADREVGEIWVESPFNFAGYFNDPDATDQALDNGWYRTGDLGYRVKERFYVAGRLKDVLIVGGVNVFPQDIEDLVSSVAGVRPGRASAFSVFDPKVQTERIVILAEADPCEGVAAREITQDIRQKILSALQVANFEVHLLPSGWLVKSTSGKMARSANRKKWVARFEAEIDVPVEGARQLTGS
jgi:fatty-acyl-CoA synthase